MNVQQIGSIDDPRVAPYRDLSDRQLHRVDGRFIAEGAYCVERLLSGEHTAESVLLSPPWLDRMAAHVGDVPVYLADEPTVHRIVGFEFHRGVLACGRRWPAPPLEHILPAAVRMRGLRPGVSVAEGGLGWRGSVAAIGPIPLC